MMSSKLIDIDNVDRFMHAILETGIEYGFNHFIKDYKENRGLIKVVNLSSSIDLNAITIYIYNMNRGESVRVGDYAISKFREASLLMPISLAENEKITIKSVIEDKVIVGYYLRTRR